MKKFALAVRKVSEGGSVSGDEGSTFQKKGDKGRETEPDAVTIREQKKPAFADVIWSN